MPRMDSLKGLARLLFWGGGILGIVIGILRWQFVDIAIVSDMSMIPTLWPGDQIAIWRRGEPSFGDVTVCAHPQQPGAYVVSRILGKPNDRLSLGGDTLGGRQDRTRLRGAGVRFETFRVNNRRVDFDELRPVIVVDPVTGFETPYAHRIEHLGNNPHHVFADPGSRFLLRRPHPTGFFMLGDNRTAHQNDSRSFGEMPPGNCRGIVIARLRPGKVPVPAEAEGVEHGWFDIIR